MSVIAEEMSIAAETTTGNKSYTLTKFTGVTPKLILVHSAKTGGSTGSSHFQMVFGAATSASNQYCITGHDEDNATASDSSRGQSASLIYRLHTTTGNVDEQASLVSMDTNGFTLNWTTVRTSSTGDFRLLVIGGSDITNVTVHRFIANTSATSQSVTGVGFQPDGAVVCSSRQSTDSSTKQTDLMYVLGAISKSGTCMSISGSCDHNTMNNDERFQVWSSSKIAAIDQMSAVVDWDFDHTSWDSDGFTLNWTTADTADRIYFVCIKGRDIAVANSTVPTSAGTDELTLNLKAEALMTFSTSTTTASGTAENYYAHSIGTADDTAEHTSGWRGDHDDPSDTGRVSSASLVVRQPESGSTAVRSEAQINAGSGAWGASSVTLDWTTVGGTADHYFVAGIEAAEVVAGDTVAPLASVHRRNRNVLTRM